MLARRIIAVSPDEAFGGQLAIALQGVGTVATYRTIDELGEGDIEAALCVIHFDAEDELAHTTGILPRLSLDCRVIAILPRSSLSSVVAIMSASDRVAGMMIAESFDAAQLGTVATRLLSGDLFGLDKLMAGPVHREVVADFEQRSRCISKISAFAEQAKVPRQFHESIEQCVDEMLMNALYDAPVDDHGKPIFADIPTATRVTLDIPQTVGVQYACDGQRFAVAVRDGFGSLERQSLLRVLDKCFHDDDKIDRKAGGAGVGLYLMVSSATSIYFNLVPGLATEVICVFDLAAGKLQLSDLGFFVVPTDITGTLVPTPRQPAGTPPIERSRAAKRGVVPLLSSAIAIAAVLLIGVAVWRLVFVTSDTGKLAITTIPDGATIEIEGRLAGVASGSLSVGDLEIGRPYAVVAKLDGYEPKHVVVQPHAGTNELSIELAALPPTVQLDSEPPGATVEIGGKVMGATPLALTSLAPKQRVAIVFKRIGYRDATVQVTAPASGQTNRVTEKLIVSDDFVRVHFVSNPPGARVIQLPEVKDAARTYTPAEIFVEAEKVQRFMLTMPNHVPAFVEPFTLPRGPSVEPIEKTAELVEGVTLHVEAAGDGVISVSNAPHCTDAAVPVDCTLAPGTYVVDYTGSNHAHVKQTVTITNQDASVRF